MERGDLGTFHQTRTVVVLEGVLVNIPEPPRRILSRQKVSEPVPPEKWAWDRHHVKVLNNQSFRFGRVFDVVTFISQDVADLAADWFLRYDVQVSTTEHKDFDMFCESLLWMPDVERVVDSRNERLDRYGSVGYRVEYGRGEF